jgi:hypothetical protein
MKIVTIDVDAGGKSRFKDETLPMTDKGRFGRFSDLQPAPGVLFRESDADYDSGWHTVPNPLYLIILGGKIEITVGTGEKRVFGPGSIIRATDATGEGHSTRSVSSEPIRSVLVNLQ